MTGFEELEERVRREIGVRLFTVLAWVPQRRALRRVHSSHPEQYPVGGEKTIEVAQDWLATCIEGRRPYFGPDKAAVRQIFADHELIESLGCSSIINVPVLGDDGEVLGVLNILHAEGTYDDASVAAAEALAKDAAAGFTGGAA
ncbi:GAF domain-containing protein [Nonomuraea sp. NPDC004297]